MNIDVDQEIPEYLARFPWIVERKGADTSRPPANYRLDYENRFYTVWRRDPAIAGRGTRAVPGPVRRRRAALVSARSSRFAAAAAPGEEIAVSIRPRGERLDTAHERSDPHWGPHPYVARRGGAATGRARCDTALVFDGGTYRIWVAGSFGRDLSVRLDGQEVGRVSGVNTDGEWLDGGVVRVARRKPRRSG